MGAGAVFECGFERVRDDAHLDVDGAHDFADGFELSGEPGGSDEAAGAGDHDGVRCAEAVGEGSGEEAAEGCHADEGHGVVAHDAATLVFGDEGLDDGVAGGETLHHSEADDEHKDERQGEDVGETEEDKAAAEHDGGDLDHGGEAADGFAHGQRDGRDERANARGSHEIAEGVWAAVEDLRGEDGHEHHEGHTHEAEQSEEEKDGADGVKVGDVGPAFLELDEHGGGGAADGGGGDVHHEERDDDGDVAEAVDGEAVALADGCDDDAGDGGADEASHVDHGGVEGDGVREVAFVFDHLDEEGLAAGHVEGVDEALQGTEGDDLVDGDDLCEGERGHGKGLNAGEDLGPDEELAAVHAVDDDAGEGREEEGGDLAGEADGAEEKRGAGETVDEPAGGDAGHPGADEGDALAGEEEAEVAMAQGSPGMGEAARSRCCRGRG